MTAVFDKDYHSHSDDVDDEEEKKSEWVWDIATDGAPRQLQLSDHTPSLPLNNPSLDLDDDVTMMNVPFDIN